MRLLICGGGTLGHITPGLAIAEKILKEFEGSTVAFALREGGSENEIVKKAGYPIYTVKIEGFNRKISLKTVKSIVNVAKASGEAKKILTRFKPDAVIGMGGYVCYPIVKEAQKMGIATLIHEANAVLGLSARLLARGADKLLLGFDSEDIKKRFSRAIFVGNPVRKEFYKYSRDAARASLGLKKTDIFILSVGGSIGAKVLNDMCIDMMRTVSAPLAYAHHMHISGKRYYEEIKNEYPSLCENGKDKIVPFRDDMPRLLCSADIVISRCGAMTIAEICAVGVAPILIPSPNVTNDHQMKNALNIKSKGGGIIIEENDGAGQHLKETLIKLIRSPKARLNLVDAQRTLSKENTLEIITKEIVDAIEKRQGG